MLKLTVSRPIFERLSRQQRAAIESTLEALIDVDLDDVVIEIAARVFPPGARAQNVIGDDGTFDPFFELLLHELQHAATVPGWSRRMRSHAARAAITDAGF